MTTVRELEQRFAPRGEVQRIALDRAGRYLVAKAREAFSKQGRDGKGAWVPRGVPNVAGILSDLERGNSIAERRFDARPAGMDTGRLRAAVFYEVRGDYVVVGSRVHYAKKFQEGGATVIPVPKSTAAKLRRLLGGLRQRLGPTPGFRRLARLASGKVTSFTVRTRGRVFVAITESDRGELKKIVRAAARGRA